MVKNSFKLKHLALSLMIAGITAGPAFATAYEAETKSTIQGHKPVLRAKSKDGLPEGADNTVAYKTLKANGTVVGKDESLRVGDRVIIYYNLFDHDGDTESDEAGGKFSAKDAQFWYKNKNDTWVKVDESVYRARKPGEVQIIVAPEMVDATGLGLLIRAQTQYGAPKMGSWLSIRNIFGDGAPNSTDDQPANPGSGGDGTGGGDNNDGGGKVDPNHPIIDGTLTAGIFKVTGDVGQPLTIHYNLDYAHPADGNTISPTIGERFIAGLYDSSLDPSRNQVNADNLIVQHDKWNWSLVSGKDTTINADVGIIGPVDFAIDKESDGIVTLQVNSHYAGIPAKAGAQGLHLKATSDQ